MLNSADGFWQGTYRESLPHRSPYFGAGGQALPHGFAAGDQTFDAMSMCSTSLMLGPRAIYIMDRLSRLRAAVPAHQEVQWQFREHGEGTTLDRRVGLCPHRYSQEEPQI
jgi:hypothetical protein